jgi:hypothetical protein
MSGVFLNIVPHRSASVYLPPLRTHSLGGEGGGGGGSIFWKTPDTALYSTKVSTLWVGIMRQGVNEMLSVLLCDDF